MGPEESFACGGATRLAAPREGDAPPPPLQQYFASDYAPLTFGVLALQPGFALDANQQVEPHTLTLTLTLTLTVTTHLLP